MRNTSSRTVLAPFQRYWWVAIPAFLASMGAAVGYLILTPNAYEAIARLSVEDERASVSDIGQTLSETDDLGGANPIVTQAEVVKSQGVLRSALDRYAEKRSGLIKPGRDTQLVTALPTVDQLAEALTVNILPATNIVEIHLKDDDPRQAANIVNAIAQAAVTQNVEDISFQASAIRSFLEPQLSAAQSRLQQAEQAESLYRQQNGLLSVTDQNQQMVSSLAALEQEERSLVAALQEMATRDQRLKSVTGIRSPEAAFAAARVEQDAQLNTLRSQLTEASIALNEARSRLGDRHPDLLALVDQFRGLDSLYQQRLNQLGGGLDGSGSAIAPNDLNNQLLAQSINSTIEAEAIASRLAVVRADVARLRAELVGQPSLQQPLAELTRESEDAAASLELIRTKLEEARVAEAQLVSNVRVLGLAEPNLEAVSPKPLPILALGAIAGTILSIGGILLLDLLDVSLQSDEDVEKLVKLPVLGYLPRLASDFESVAELDAFLDSPQQVEPYRSLLKAIESRQYRQRLVGRNGASQADDPQPNGLSERSAADQQFAFGGRMPDGARLPQVIAISSPTQQEGAAAVVTRLGAVAAMLGRRTLIIEANPQNPIQHHHLQVEAEPGLTDAINNGQLLPEAVKLTTIGRLSVLPYGQQLDRPSTVIESAAMRVLLKNLGQNYDLVLVDTAPVDESTDATTLSQLTDGLLLVTLAGHTPRQVLSETVQQLRTSGAPLLGIAMNETQSRQSAADTERSQPPVAARNGSRNGAQL